MSNTDKQEHVTRGSGGPRPHQEIKMKTNASRARERHGDQAEFAAKYIFDNGGKQADSRFRELSRLYDERTMHYIESRGIREGWSCLEVGGGGGSIAAWLCRRTGVSGRVLATDIDPMFLQTLSFPNLEVRRHDIRSEPLPRLEFDLVHARLVLMHLPERETALKRMVAALKPGGWIVVEEFDDAAFLPDHSENSHGVDLKLRYAFQQVLTSHGVDMRYGRSLPYEFKGNGLVNIGAEASASIWKAGSPGSRLMKLTLEELRGMIIGSGLVSESEFVVEMKRVDEEDYLVTSPMMCTAWGQLPEERENLPSTSFQGCGI